jgi:hypothetical protein
MPGSAASWEASGTCARGWAGPNFAQLYRFQTKFAKAEQLYQRSPATMKNAHGPDHLDVRGPIERLDDCY